MRGSFKDNSLMVNWYMVNCVLIDCWLRINDPRLVGYILLSQVRVIELWYVHLLVMIYLT